MASVPRGSCAAAAAAVVVSAALAEHDAPPGLQQPCNVSSLFAAVVVSSRRFRRFRRGSFRVFDLCPAWHFTSSRELGVLHSESSLVLRAVYRVLIFLVPEFSPS